MSNIARGHTSHTHAASMQYTFFLLHYTVSQNKVIGKPVPSTSVFGHHKAGTAHSLVMVTEIWTHLKYKMFVTRNIREIYALYVSLGAKLYCHVKNAHTEFCDLSLD